MTKLLTVFLTMIMTFAPFMATAEQGERETVLLIKQNASSDPLHFTIPDLQAMPQTKFQTSTIWTPGITEFTGVPLSQLLGSVGIDKGVIRARAANDYAVDIPIASLSQFAPIVAWGMDGEMIPRRTKGPLWIVFPYDMDAAFRTETIYSQSIWQLKGLDVLD